MPKGLFSRSSINMTKTDFSFPAKRNDFFFCNATINIEGTGSAFVQSDVKLFLFYD